MKFNRYLICALFLVLICCIGAASAADAGDDVVAADDAIDEAVSEAIDVSDEIDEEPLGVSEEPALSDGETSSSSEKVIYVGQNRTLDGGNGSFDNPYRTFKLACDSITGEDKVTINVFAGTYYLGDGWESDLSSPLKFNTNNLNIVGNGSVIIKNYFNDNLALNAEAFSLYSSSAKFNFSNLIFDATSCEVTVWADPDYDEYNYFMPFYGETDLGIFENCSFIGFANTAGKTISGLSYNSKFINCYFEGGSSGLFDNTEFPEYTSPRRIDTFTSFENCTFDINGILIRAPTVQLPDWNISMKNVWLGQNNIPNWVHPRVFWDLNEHYNYDFVIPINRYAVFNVTQNYLGNSKYEIVGKLTWNGTEDQDGMENFQHMDVILESSTGVFDSNTVTLVDGNFRTIYTSNSPNNLVTATLHKQPIELEFTNVNITCNPVSIHYGDDQNITFNFTQPITANVTVTVSNGSYSKSERVEVIGKDSLVYTVPDTLKEGTYDVEINLAENNLFGFNTTTLTVSKVSDYIFEVVTGPVKVGETATVNITLPADVNGTVVIKFGNDTKELNASQTMTVPFTNLNATEYSVDVSYGGNDKYVARDYPTAFVTVDPVPSGLEIEDATFTYGDIIAIPFNMTNADGVDVVVYNQDNDPVATTSSEIGIINLDVLPAGKYSLDVETIVGSNYESVLKKINLTINKANSSLDISNEEFSYASEAVINAVTENSTDDVIAILTDENNTEIAVTVSGDSITLPKLDAGTYTLTVTTNPDENHNNVTKSATITIIKTTPSMNVIVEPTENITAKDNVTLTIKLPTDATGNVAIKINGKQLDTIDANETITVKLNNQPGEYIADITYSGDNNYESDSTTQQYTIKKAETSITAKQTPSEEGTATIEANITDVDSGIILVDIDGKKFYGDINNGKATVNIEGMPEGNYTANIKFSGITDDLADANAKVDDLTGELANATDKIADLTDDLVDANAKVDDLTVELNETQANASKLSDDLADANAKVDDLTGELANVTDKIADLTDDLADANAKVDNLTVELNETQANATKLSEDLVAANQTIDDLLKQLEEAKANATNVTVPETVVIDGVEYPIEYVNGTATVETNKTEPVVPKSSEFSEITINDDLTISIVLKDSDGNVIASAPITYIVNGAVQFTTTDNDGKFTFKGEDGALIIINYAGDTNITGTNTTLKLNSAAVPEVVKVAAQFNISDRAITINGYAVDGPAGEQGIYYATTLLDANGKPISNVYMEFAVNNKIYNRTTYENGSFNPYKLNMVRAGRYTMAFNFAGDENYTNAFACVCVDLNKKPITIKAPAKTYKAAAKTKKYTATLSTIPSVYDGKVYLSPKTVKLTANGKTFTGKTNSKGQVTFKITNLNKKGTYTAKISYKGDKTYEEATQKVKLTIK